jgi:hypothetical protein
MNEALLVLSLQGIMVGQSTNELSANFMNI